MSKALFTNTWRLKSITPIQENVDDDILKPYIFIAQETYIQQATGTALYNKLQADVIANTLTGNYKTLVDDYIVPCLIQWAFYEAMPFVSLKITNKGIARGNADYLDEVGLDELKYLRNIVMETAKFYESILIGYLKQNNSLFPEYWQNTGLDKIKPDYGRNFFGGIYIPNKRRDDDWGVGRDYKDLI